MTETEKRNAGSMHFDRMETLDMVRLMNEENARSVRAVGAAEREIAEAVEAVAAAFGAGGRLFYVGAGTSGRLAGVDASECPPTFGVDPSCVTAVMAGGERAITHAAENIEDNADAGARDLLSQSPQSRDVVMGVSASGGAAYVIGAMKAAKELGCVTISLSSVGDCPMSRLADIAIFTDTGAEVITGSTRLKAGNAQKMVLNMITTCAMAKTGKVYENLMINLRPTNKKLRNRMIRIVSTLKNVDEATAEALLDAHGFNIRRVMEETQ
ncbi:MAG: N-acetylmuramic acid 6-phosphate etherase [Eubacteriales bacterium]|nr:N-acetylmuramic acid 6-phosphate etherase [Eubacteriales bacterium]